MDFTTICQRYALGTLFAFAPIKPGTVAQVWQVRTSEGAYLVRTLTGKGQGEREWAVAQHLTVQGFASFPAILTTKEGAPMLALEGVWYQVQNYCSGEMPDPAVPGTAAAMARIIRELSQCMPAGLIHGDLGPWNMVQQVDGTLSVIDFGTVREGDPYFDFAAAFGGIINHTSGQERVCACREFLSELDADRGRLLEQLQQWAEEGITRWNGQSEKMTTRFYHALNWAKENLYDL